jgi:hypothetical protein
VYLSGPIIIGRHPLHLDALLTYAAAIVRDGRDALDFVPGPSRPAPRIPLESAPGPLPLYRASAARLVPPIVPVRVSLASRQPRDGERLFPAMSSVPLGTGPLRAGLFSYPAVLARGLVFYGVGDPGETARLMTFIHAIGKRRATGMGDIDPAGARVDPIPEDRTWVWRGEVMRVLPVHLARARRAMRGRAPACAVERAAYSPPYHDRRQARLALCYVPRPFPVISDLEIDELARAEHSAAPALTEA